jgi:hypothetical protein
MIGMPLGDRGRIRAATVITRLEGGAGVHALSGVRLGTRFTELRSVTHCWRRTPQGPSIRPEVP